MSNEISGNNQYSQKYLDAVNDVMTNRMDNKDNGGNGDGKVDIYEALNDLHLSDLLSGLKEGSAEYTKLKGLTDQVPAVLQKYAGDDGIFSTKEWADFLNGQEWNSVMDAYHHQAISLR